MSLIKMVKLKRNNMKQDQQDVLQTAVESGYREMVDWLVELMIRVRNKVNTDFLLSLFFFHYLY